MFLNMINENTYENPFDPVFQQHYQYVPSQRYRKFKELPCKYAKNVNIKTNSNPTLKNVSFVTWN